MKIDQLSLDIIKSDLRKIPKAPWIRISAQIQNFGDEAHFWLIISDFNLRHKAVEEFLRYTRRSLAIFDQTQFYCAFCVVEGQYEILCAYLADEDMRSGNLEFVFLDEAERKKFDEKFWSDNT